MTKKYRLTGCSKFLVFLIIAGPLAFFGAYYINTGDPMAGLKAVGIGNETQVDQKTDKEEKTTQASIEDLRMKVDELSKALEDCQNNKESTPNQE